MNAKKALVLLTVLFGAFSCNISRPTPPAAPAAVKNVETKNPVYSIDYQAISSSGTVLSVDLQRRTVRLAAEQIERNYNITVDDHAVVRRGSKDSSFEALAPGDFIYYRQSVINGQPVVNFIWVGQQLQTYDAIIYSTDQLSGNVTFYPYVGFHTGTFNGFTDEFSGAIRPLLSLQLADLAELTVSDSKATKFSAASLKDFHPGDTGVSIEVLKLGADSVIVEMTAEHPYLCESFSAPPGCISYDLQPAEVSDSWQTLTTGRYQVDYPSNWQNIPVLGFSPKNYNNLSAVIRLENLQSLADFRRSIVENPDYFTNSANLNINGIRWIQYTVQREGFAGSIQKPVSIYSTAEVNGAPVALAVENTMPDSLLMQVYTKMLNSFRPLQIDPNALLKIQPNQ